MDPLELPATRESLQRLLESGLLTSDQYVRARRQAGLVPNQSRWQSFLDHTLAFLGAVLLALGIVLFFAYNWADMHRYFKFGLIASGMLTAILVTQLKGLESITGKASLVFACILTGVLLSVYGQTYQTGADPYGLFLGWALLISGWVLIGRNQVLWLLLFLLFNLALILYWGEMINPAFGIGMHLVNNPLLARFTAIWDLRLAELLIVLNLVFLAAWEIFLRRGLTWLKGHWMPRVIASYAVLMLTQIAMMYVFRSHRLIESQQILPAAIYISGIGVLIAYYRFAGKDLYMIAIAYFSLIIVISSLLVKHVVTSLEGGILLTFTILILSALAAISLKKIAAQWRFERDAR